MSEPAPVSEPASLPPASIPPASLPPASIPPASLPPASLQGGGPGKWVLVILRWLLFAGCIGLFARALAKSDLGTAWVHIRGMGPLALLVIVPFPIALAFDTWAWKILFLAIDRKVPLPLLFKVRLATEAVTNSVPVGAIWADALAPVLVSRRAHVPIEDVFATATAKRWTVVRAHATYMAAATLFGWSAVAHASRPLLGNGLLLYICFGSAVFLACFSTGFETLAARGQVAGRVSGMLGKTRFVRVSAWVEKRRHHFAAADRQLAKLASSPAAELGATWRLVGMWVTEGLETYLIFKLLGVPLGFFEILSMDAAMSVVRSMAVFAPSGIGIQDVGYLAMLEAYGVPGAATLGPAFVVIKRAKEALWLGIGFAMLARLGPRKALAEAKQTIDAES